MEAERGNAPTIAIQQGDQLQANFGEELVVDRSRENFVEEGFENICLEEEGCFENMSLEEVVMEEEHEQFDLLAALQPPQYLEQDSDEGDFTWNYNDAGRHLLPNPDLATDRFLGRGTTSGPLFRLRTRLTDWELEAADTLFDLSKFIHLTVLLLFRPSCIVIYVLHSRCCSSSYHHSGTILDMSARGMDQLNQYVTSHVEEALRIVFPEGGAQLTDALATAKRKVPNPTYLKKKVFSLCNREWDGDLERHFFHVPPDYKDQPGILSNKVMLEFQNPVSACVELLLDPSIASAQTYVWEAKPYDGTYKNIDSGFWFRDAERRSGVLDHFGTFLMPIVFNTDAASVDGRQSVSLKPINMTCMNLVGSVCRTSRGKRCLGFWPKLNITKAASDAAAARLQRIFYQWVIEKFMESIEKYRNGIRLVLLDGVERVLIPVVAFGVTDWPDGQKCTNTKEGAVVSKCNCRVCLRPTALFSQTECGASGYERRLDEDTRAKIENFAGQTKAAREEEEMKVSQWLESPLGWWKGELYRDKYGIHSMFPMDVLHTVPYGIVAHLKDILIGHTKEKSKLDELNRRFAVMPLARDTRRRGLAYKSFPKGILAIGKLTGDDYTALLQQFPFVVGYGDKVIANASARRAFLEACECARTILVILKLPEITGEHQLKKLHDCAKKMGPLLFKCTIGLTDAVKAKLMTDNRPKVHALLHFRYFIRLYGSALNFDTSTWETFHKEVCHIPFSRDSNHNENREHRLMRQVHSRTSLRSLAEQSVPDPEPRPRTLHFKVARHQTVGQLLDVIDAGREPSDWAPCLKQVLDNANCLAGTTAAELRDMAIFSTLVHDHGEDTTLYAASPSYRNGLPRFDTVSVVYEGADGEDTTWPARLELLFGSTDTYLIDGNSADSCRMYALVWSLNDVARNRIPSELLSFPCYRYATPGFVDSYEVVEVGSLNGHAHIVPDFDTEGRQQRHQRLLWWDNTTVAGLVEQQD